MNAGSPTTVTKEPKQIADIKPTDRFVTHCRKLAEDYVSSNRYRFARVFPITVVLTGIISAFSLVYVKLSWFFFGPSLAAGFMLILIVLGDENEDGGPIKNRLMSWVTKWPWWEYTIAGVCAFAFLLTAVLVGFWQAVVMGGVCGVGLGMIFYVGITLPLKETRGTIHQGYAQIVKTLQKYGVSRLEVELGSPKLLGTHWMPLFEQVFGYEAYRSVAQQVGATEPELIRRRRRFRDFACDFLGYGIHHSAGPLGTVAAFRQRQLSHAADKQSLNSLASESTYANHDAQGQASMDPFGSVQDVQDPASTVPNAHAAGTPAPHSGQNNGHDSGGQIVTSHVPDKSQLTDQDIFGQQPVVQGELVDSDPFLGDDDFELEDEYSITGSVMGAEDSMTARVDQPHYPDVAVPSGTPVHANHAHMLGPEIDLNSLDASKLNVYVTNEQLDRLVGRQPQEKKKRATYVGDDDKTERILTKEELVKYRKIDRFLGDEARLTCAFVTMMIFGFWIFQSRIAIGPSAEGISAAFSQISSVRSGNDVRRVVNGLGDALTACTQSIVPLGISGWSVMIVAVILFLSSIKHGWQFSLFVIPACLLVVGGLSARLVHGAPLQTAWICLAIAAWILFMGMIWEQTKYGRPFGIYNVHR